MTPSVWKRLPERWWLVGVLVVLFALALLIAKIVPDEHPSATAAKTASRGGPQSLFLGDGNGGNIEIQQPVEQWTDWQCCEFLQPWVTNPTGVAWDVDDHWEKIDVDATLAANTTVTSTSQEVADVDPTWHCLNGLCAWWSGGKREFQVFVGAPASTLLVSTCYAPQSRCFNAPAVYDKPNKRYVYGMCVTVRYTNDDPAVAMIPGSGGDAFTSGPTRGLGLLTTETVRIGNPTSHTVRNIAAFVQMVGTGGDGAVCSPTTHHIDTVDYPFSWFILG